MSLAPQKVDFDEVWGRLSEGVSRIITMKGTKGMPLFEDVYKICTAPDATYSQRLYYKLKEFLENHVEKLKTELLTAQSDLLPMYLKRWQNYSTGSAYCAVVFRYLDMHWIKQQQDDARNRFSPNFAQGKEIYDLALVSWKTAIFDIVKERLAKGIVDLVTRERDGESIDQQLVQGLILSFLKLGQIRPKASLEIYKQHLEPLYLKALSEYYMRESDQYIVDHGVPAYLIQAETRIAEEEARAKKYLDTCSFEKVKTECNSALIVRHKQSIQSYCEEFLRANRISDLKRMYKLFSRVQDGLKQMLDTFFNFIVNTGNEAIRALMQSSKKNDKLERADSTNGSRKARSSNISDDIGAQEYVETLLDVHSKFSEMVRLAFDNDQHFTSEMDKACRRLVNDNPACKTPGKSSELIAKYADSLLKKRSKHMAEDELDNRLTNIILVFKYVDDKDVFQKFYSKMLAKRLIHGTSLSEDSEKMMVSYLKEVCGFEYTIKLMRMFTDMQTSVSSVEKFKEFLSSKNVKLPLDFSITVLTAGAWPLPPSPCSFNVPYELEQCIKEFTAFYNEQYSGRKLTWLHHLSKGDLKMLYTKRRYECQVTTFQMGVLLLFNINDVYSVQDIQTAVGIQEDEFRRVLHSLIDAKILTKNTATKTLAPTDELSLNMGFNSKRIKFKVVTTLQAETQQQNAETRKQIEDDRKFLLQAVIVRIMKSRKTLKHNHLIQEVIEHCKARFHPSIQMIKKCIEQLIDKEYLERSADSDMYLYRA